MYFYYTDASPEGVIYGGVILVAPLVISFETLIEFSEDEVLRAYAWALEAPNTEYMEERWDSRITIRSRVPAITKVQ